MWKFSVILIYYYLCCFQHITSTRIVTKAFIVWEKSIIVCSCERFYTWEFSYYIIEVFSDSWYLSLLQENLTYPHVIGSLQMSPWEIMTTMIFVPVEDDLERKWFHIYFTQDSIVNLLLSASKYAIVPIGILIGFFQWPMGSHHSIGIFNFHNLSLSTSIIE